MRKDKVVKKNKVARKNKIKKNNFLYLILLGLSVLCPSISFGMQPEQTSGQNSGEKNRYGIWGWACCAMCCVMPEDDQVLLARTREEEEGKRKNALFALAVQQGDTGQVRKYLEKDFFNYLYNYMRYTQGTGDATPEFTFLARNIVKSKKAHNLLGQRDENLDKLACIALLRFECDAVLAFLQAGADVKALETTPFRYKQIVRVADLSRYGAASMGGETVYTPLHYFLQFKRVFLKAAADQPPFDALIEQLVTAGVDFHTPTPAKKVPYLEASEHDQEIIAKAEQARERGLRQARRLAKKQANAAPGLELSFATCDVGIERWDKAEQAARERLAREIVGRKIVIATKKTQQPDGQPREQDTHVLEQDAQAPAQDVPNQIACQNIRIRERSAPAVGLEQKNPEESSEDKSAQQPLSALETLKAVEQAMDRRHAALERFSALAHKSFKRDDSVSRKRQNSKEDGVDLKRADSGVTRPKGEPGTREEQAAEAARQALGRQSRELRRLLD